MSRTHDFSALVLALFLACLAVPANAQNGSDCNDIAREKTSSGGNTKTYTDCSDVSIIISIAGQAFEWSSPDQCADSVRVQDSDCFTCTQSADGNHCLDDQFHVLVKIYSSGGENPCPSFPESLPETLTEAYRSTQCTPPPLLHEENVGCSASRPCSEGEDVPANYVHGEVGADPTNPGGIRREWLGDLTGSLPGPVEDPDAALIDSLPRISQESLPAAIALLRERCPELAGADGINARVELEYPQGTDGQPIKNVYDVFGTLLEGGRFALMMPRWVEAEGGELERVLEDLAYDGATLVYGLVGGDTYQAYASSCSTIDDVLLTQAGFLRSLQAWIGDPYECLRIAGTEYEVEPLANGGAEVIESYPEPDFPAWSGTQVYRLGSPSIGGLPTRIDTLSQSGELLRRREYSKYRRLKDGTWRPFHLVDAKYQAGSETPYFVLRTTIQSVAKTFDSSADAQEVFVMPEPASGWWVVHE